MTVAGRAFSKELSREEIDSLVRQSLGDILRVVRPRKVILIGSALGERFDEASDLDFVVVFATVEEAVAGRKALYRMKRSVPRAHDFICVDETTFAEKSEIGGILYVAAREGRKLFAQD